MDLSFETIDAFRAVVGKISTDVFAKIPPKPNTKRSRHNNDFANDPLNGRLPSYDFVDGGETLRIFCGSEYAVFCLSDIRIREIESIEYGDPMIINKNVDSVVVKSWLNNSGTTEEHKLTTKKAFSRTETRASATAFALEITQSLRTKIGGGVKGIGEAEVETGLQVKTNFEQRFETSKTTSSSEEETEEQTYTVGPFTKTTLLREEGMSDYEQKVTTTGILDARMWIDSHYDFGFNVDSFVSLDRLVKGGSAPNVDWYIQKYFAERHFQNYVIDFSPLKVTVEDILNFRNVQSSELERTDTPIAKS